jgi:hypothetical protein
MYIVYVRRTFNRVYVRWSRDRGYGSTVQTGSKRINTSNCVRAGIMNGSRHRVIILSARAISARARHAHALPLRYWHEKNNPQPSLYNILNLSRKLVRDHSTTPFTSSTTRSDLGDRSSSYTIFLTQYRSCACFTSNYFLKILKVRIEERKMCKRKTALNDNIILKTYYFKLKMIMF